MGLFKREIKGKNIGYAIRIKSRNKYNKGMIENAKGENSFMEEINKNGER